MSITFYPGQLTNTAIFDKLNEILIYNHSFCTSSEKSSV